jgi:hypothetical protein
MYLEYQVEIAKFTPEILSLHSFLACGPHLLSRQKCDEQLQMTRLGLVQPVSKPSQHLRRRGERADAQPTLI